MAAAWKGELAVVKQLLEEERVDIDGIDWVMNALHVRDQHLAEQLAMIVSIHRKKVQHSWQLF